MPKFNVHLYREMRLFYPDIEAETPEEAARKVRDNEASGVIEDCDGATIAALVDEVGDEEFANSVTIDFMKLTPVEENDGIY